MLSSLEIRRFRAFDRFSMQGLSRVNLLLGGNNAGKTTIMEAAELLLARGAPWAFARSAQRRGDGLVIVSTGTNAVRRAVSIRYLFHGHQLTPGSSFELDATGRSDVRLRCELRQTGENEPDPEQMRLQGPDGRLLGEEEVRDLEPELELMIASPSRVDRVRLGSGGVMFERVPRPDRDEEGTPINFVDTRDPEFRLTTLWDRIVLTPREEEVVQAIRLVEPGVDRLAQLSSQSGFRNQMVVKRRDIEDPVPLGTMGDGAKRLLVLAVNLVNSAKGYLLVDEIDTGLHHTVLRPMWRLVLATARRLDVQVFASTHSLDCVRALAWALEQDSDFSTDVSVQRVVRGRNESVQYTGSELQLAVEQDMEIR